jgi:hypothetical protein
VSSKGKYPTPKKPAITRNRDWRIPFLLALAESGNVTAACSAAMVDKTTAYERRQTDAEFGRRWKEALSEAADLLELEARRRAEKGVDEPIVYQGELAGQWVDEGGNPCQKGTPNAKFMPLTIKKYSDTLLIFLLKGIRPKKYRETLSVKHSGKIKHKHGATKSLLAKIKGDEKASEALSILASRMKQPNVN